MQNEISTIFNSMFSQDLGMTDAASLMNVASFGLFLVGPGIVMFVILFCRRELFRPRWRGYWDAV